MSSEVAKLKAWTASIRFVCKERDVKAFWVSFQRRGDISVGTTDEKYQVEYVREEQTQGAPQIVHNPHVTFHPPHWTEPVLCSRVVG